MTRATTYISNDTIVYLKSPIAGFWLLLNTEEGCVEPRSSDVPPNSGRNSPPRVFGVELSERINKLLRAIASYRGSPASFVKKFGATSFFQCSGSVRIGRLPTGNEIVLKDNSISGGHLTISWRFVVFLTVGGEAFIKRAQGFQGEAKLLRPELVSSLRFLACVTDKSTNGSFYIVKRDPKNGVVMQAKKLPSDSRLLFRPSVFQPPEQTQIFRFETDDATTNTQYLSLGRGKQLGNGVMAPVFSFVSHLYVAPDNEAVGNPATFQQLGSRVLPVINERIIHPIWDVMPNGNVTELLQELGGPPAPLDVDDDYFPSTPAATQEVAATDERSTFATAGPFMFGNQQLVKQEEPSTSGYSSTVHAGRRSLQQAGGSVSSGGTYAASSSHIEVTGRGGLSEVAGGGSPQLAQLMAELTEVKRARDTLSSEAEALARTVDEAKRGLVEAEAKIRDLQYKLSNAEEQAAREANTVELLKGATREATHHKEQAQELSTQLEILRSRNATANSQVSQLSKERDELSSERAKLIETNEELEMRRRQITEQLRTTKDQLESSEEKISALKQQLSEEKAARRSAESEKISIEANAKLSMGELNSLRAAKLHLESTLSKVRQEVDVMKSALQTRDSQLGDLKQRYAAIQNELKVHQQHIMGIADSFESVQTYAEDALSTIKHKLGHLRRSVATVRMPTSAIDEPAAAPALSTLFNDTSEVAPFATSLQQQQQPPPTFSFGPTSHAANNDAGIDEAARDTIMEGGGMTTATDFLSSDTQIAEFDNLGIPDATLGLNAIVDPSAHSDDDSGNTQSDNAGDEERQAHMSGEEDLEHSKVMPQAVGDEPTQMVEEDGGTGGNTVVTTKGGSREAIRSGNMKPVSSWHMLATDQMDSLLLAANDGEEATQRVDPGIGDVRSTAGRKRSNSAELMGLDGGIGTKQARRGSTTNVATNESSDFAAKKPRYSMSASSSPRMNAYANEESLFTVPTATPLQEEFSETPTDFADGPSETGVNDENRAVETPVDPQRNVVHRQTTKGKFKKSNKLLFPPETVEAFN